MADCGVRPAVDTAKPQSHDLQAGHGVRSRLRVHRTHGSQQCSAAGEQAGTSDPKAPARHSAELDRNPSPLAELPERPRQPRPGLRAFGRLPSGGDLEDGPQRAQMSLPNAGEGEALSAGQARAREGQGAGMPGYSGSLVRDPRSEGSSCL